MTSRSRPFATLWFVAWLALGAAPLEAGTLQVTSVWLDTNDSPARTYVLVGATAEYVGTKDWSDNSASLMTFVNHSHAGSIDDWDHPDDWGQGVTVSSVEEGLVLTCDASPCAADDWVDKPICDTGRAVFVKGKAGATVYHHTTPEIDLEYTPALSLPCYVGDLVDIDGPDGCATAILTETTAFSVETGEQLPVSRIDHAPERFERFGSIHFLMDDWAVLSYHRGGLDGGPTVEPRLATSGDFANAAMTPAARLLRTATPPRGRGTLLLVQTPVHRQNDRHIPSPRLALETDLPVDDFPARRLAIRAAFSEAGHLDSLDVLHTDGLLDAGLLDALEDRLRLVYQTTERHRAFAFAIIQTRPTLEILTSLTGLPQCCCGTDDVFCL